MANTHYWRSTNGYYGLSIVKINEITKLIKWARQNLSCWQGFLLHGSKCKRRMSTYLDYYQMNKITSNIYGSDQHNPAQAWSQGSFLIIPSEYLNHYSVIFRPWFLFYKPQIKKPGNSPVFILTVLSACAGVQRLYLIPVSWSLDTRS